MPNDKDKKRSKKTEVTKFVPIENKSLGPLREFTALRTVEDMMALQGAVLAAFMESRDDDREFYMEQQVIKKGVIFNKKYTSKVILKRRRG